MQKKQEICAHGPGTSCDEKRDKCEFVIDLLTKNLNMIATSSNLSDSFPHFKVCVYATKALYALNSTLSVIEN